MSRASALASTREDTDVRHPTSPIQYRTAARMVSASLGLLSPRHWRCTTRPNYSSLRAELVGMPPRCANNCSHGVIAAPALPTGSGRAGWKTANWRAELERADPAAARMVQMDPAALGLGRSSERNHPREPQVLRWRRQSPHARKGGSRWAQGYDVEEVDRGRTRQMPGAQLIWACVNPAKQPPARPQARGPTPAARHEPATESQQGATSMKTGNTDPCTGLPACESAEL